VSTGPAMVAGVDSSTQSCKISRITLTGGAAQSAAVRAIALAVFGCRSLLLSRSRASQSARPSKRHGPSAAPCRTGQCRTRASRSPPRRTWLRHRRSTPAMNPYCRPTSCEPVSDRFSWPEPTYPSPISSSTGRRWPSRVTSTPSGRHAGDNRRDRPGRFARPHHDPLPDRRYLRRNGYCRHGDHELKE
jgi:hypothetical protein